MQNLESHIPKASHAYVKNLIDCKDLKCLVSPKRKTKHGDFRVISPTRFQISVNANLNTFRFLITLIHEYAHYLCYKKYGSNAKPHGLEWKLCFQKLMLPLLHPDVFPKEILMPLANHLQNPKATTDRDTYLTKILKSYDSTPSENLLDDLAEDSLFEFNNEIYRKLQLRRTRILSERLKDGRRFTFSPNAEIKPL